MKLVVGLGNPGAEYVGTRHNVGFRVLDVLASRLGAVTDAQRFRGHYREVRVAPSESLGEGRASRAPGARDEVVGLLAPHTYMNRSGEAVREACAALGSAEGLPLAPSECLVVYDDLDLALGRVRLRATGGAGGHNGIASVVEALATRDLPRLRVGISRPPPGCDPIDYVLGPFESDELEQLPVCLERAAQAVLGWVRLGIGEAMSLHNARPPAETGGREVG